MLCDVTYLYQLLTGTGSDSQKYSRGDRDRKTTLPKAVWGPSQ